MRNVTRFVDQDSPTKQLPQSKVSPMVAGHTVITRPQIQLTRLNMSRHHQEAGSGGPGQEDEDNNEPGEEEAAAERLGEEERGDEDEVLESPPRDEARPQVTRTLFNLTVIGEESRVEESPVVSSGSQAMSSLQESSEDELDEDLTLENENDESAVVLEAPPPLPRRSSLQVNLRRTGGGGRNSTSSAAGGRRSRTRRSVAFAAGVGRRSSGYQDNPESVLSPPAGILVAGTSGEDPGDEEEEEVSPDIIPSSQEAGALPSLREEVSHNRPPPPAASALSIEIPEDASDSFFERLAEDDPLEGPSWLFGSLAKKRKSSKRCRSTTVSRRLSTLLPDVDTGRSGPSSLDSSDLDLTADGSKDTSEEVSGFITDVRRAERGRQNLVCLSPETPLVKNQYASRGIGEEHMPDENLQNRENLPINLLEGYDLSAVEENRTPLRELKFDNGESVVKFNPKLETGVTVQSLRQAKIVLDNIGFSPRVGSVECRLSNCFIDLSASGGRRLSLDQLLTLGIQGLQAEVEQNNSSPAPGKRPSNSSPAPGKRPSNSSPAPSKPPSNTPPAPGQRPKKKRTTASADGRKASKTKSYGQLGRRTTTELEPAESRSSGVSAVSHSSALDDRPSPGRSVARPKSGRTSPENGGASPENDGAPTESSGAPPGSSVAPPENSDAPQENSGAPPENNGAPPENSGAPPEGGGRARRRAASNVCFKEPSLNKKLRQGDEIGSSIYKDFIPQTKATGQRKKSKRGSKNST